MPVIYITLEAVAHALPVTIQPGQMAGDLEQIENHLGVRHLRLYIGPTETCSPEKLQQTGGHLANWLVDHKEIENVSIDLSSIQALGISEGFRAFFEGVLLGSFRFDKHKSNVSAQNPSTIGIQSPAPGGVQEALAYAIPVTAAQNLARAWGHEPPNILNHLTLPDRCQTLATELGLKCTVLDDQPLEAMGAGAIVAVGRASQLDIAVLLFLRNPALIARRAHLGLGSDGSRIFCGQPDFTSLLESC